MALTIGLHEHALGIHKVEIDAVIDKIVLPGWRIYELSPSLEKIQHIRDDGSSLGGGLEKYTLYALHIALTAACVPVKAMRPGWKSRGTVFARQLQRQTGTHLVRNDGPVRPYLVQDQPIQKQVLQREAQTIQAAPFLSYLRI